ncbi:delta-aminolevulinic acid dehydratase [Seongchinamella unica]|uniref:Delta-aminolevulinic acid dehydratase n=1 Tax=Seongchinamella unica TaxID=2547392 RepID=A0A4R5LMY7_9GAMM|nr:delta-aminolevulinic acid dehydratase [Seongchinamella unica]TDG11567.1 delta-aminolevulinic acid dehydratase [Seongchinamella unica]
MFKRCWLAICLATACQTGWAECECLWQGSFADVQHETDLVVAGRIVSRKGNSVDLDIQRTLRGSTPGEEIRIWLKTADYCRPEPELFPPDSTWVMALQRIDKTVPGGFNPNTPNFSYGRIGDYRLSSCGGYWLQLRGDFVSGALVDSPRWVHDPKMTPVLLDLVNAFVNGEIGASALLEASREDPALRDLRLDTRAFLRGDED